MQLTGISVLAALILMGCASGGDKKPTMVLRQQNGNGQIGQGQIPSPPAPPAVQTVVPTYTTQAPQQPQQASPAQQTQPQYTPQQLPATAAVPPNGSQVFVITPTFTNPPPTLISVPATQQPIQQVNAPASSTTSTNSYESISANSASRGGIVLIVNVTNNNVNNVHQPIYHAPRPLEQEAPRTGNVIFRPYRAGTLPPPTAFDRVTNSATTGGTTVPTTNAAPAAVTPPTPVAPTTPPPPTT